MGASIITGAYLLTYLIDIDWVGGQTETADMRFWDLGIQSLAHLAGSPPLLLFFISALLFFTSLNGRISSGTALVSIPFLLSIFSLYSQESIQAIHFTSYASHLEQFRSSCCSFRSFVSLSPHLHTNINEISYRVTLRQNFAAIIVASMPKKAGPALLCEWMVGTTIRSALGPPPQPPKPKSKRRDVIKLHVTTDDESGEDTLTISYPRSERLREKKETQAAVSETEPEPDPEPEPKPEMVEVVKRVRFEKGATPKKSAMKKKTSVTFCEVEETKSESSADATSSSASSGEATPESSSSNASSAAETSSAGETSSGSSSKSAKASKSHRSSRNKKIDKPIQSSESEADSEPHPTCDCKECTSGRKKQKQGTACEKRKCKKNDKKAVIKRKKESESESEPETSVSEAESSAEEEPTPSKKSKEKKKGGKRVEVSNAEGETSESAKETEGESEVTVKKSPDKKKKNKESEKAEKAEKQASSPKSEEKPKPEEEKGQEKEKEKEKETEETNQANESKSKESPTGKGKEKEKDDSKPTVAEGISPTSQTKDVGQKLHYSEGYHYSHSRPPNLIAPIRSEVMQTERVVETQDDPPPNAYYDALHNVVRVYHGSVYGQNGHHMFASRENTAGLLHPSGIPHPMQNPYYAGYNNVMPMPPPQQQPPPHGYEHVPITQGMPMPGWNAMVPPPGYPLYNYQGGPPPMPAAWYEQQLNKQGTKGAFSMYNGVGGTPDRKGGNKSREPDNNVMPKVTKVCTTPEDSFSCNSSRKC